MILPPSSVAAGLATLTVHSAPATTSSSSRIPGLDRENWSSLIGIVTAIIGNVLISFALNLQRYAHIKLEHEWQEKERRRKRRTATYGTDQGKAADERAEAEFSGKYQSRRNREYSFQDEQERDEDGTVATETDALIPVRSRSKTPLRPTDVASTESDDAEEAYKQKSYLKSPWWWLGIILMTTGEAGNFLAYGFAPASIVSPLGVVALISNCIIAPFMLKERFRKRDGLGVLVAVGGAVTVVASANDNNPKLGPDDIWKLITTWEFETYLGITVGVIVILMYLSNKYGEKNILVDLGLVGLFGGYTALSTKGVASMLSYTLWRAITFPVTYLLVAILVGTAVMQIKYVNRALQRFDATQVIPTQFVLFTLSVILGSAILYRDFERTSGSDAGKFVGGCALTFLGVWMITSGRSSHHDDEEEEDRDPEPEDAINLVDGERYQDEVAEATESGAGTSTRRSSTLRAISPPVAITKRVPTGDVSIPSTPDITFTPDDVPSRSSRTPLGATPQSASSENQNPWNSPAAARPSSGMLTRHSASSTPLLPSENVAASTSNLEPLRNPSRPITPTRGHSDNLTTVTPGAGNTLTPNLRRMATAERLASRNSIAGPLLASPLSTSLSAMVADLKRSSSIRGSVSRDHDSVRRRESILGIGASEIDGHAERTGEPLDRRRTATEDALPSSQEGRKRGLSGTFRDLWREFRGASTESVVQIQDPEQGRSPRG